MDAWNPWHGCKKISPGCKNCYVYRRDESIGKDASQVYQTKQFDLPVRKMKSGQYQFVSKKTVFTCATSDFFLEEADNWREEAWRMMKQRSDLQFLIFTKRIHRFQVALPEDWNDGYKNVWIGCTVEDQKRAEERLPFFLSLPIQHKIINCEPILEQIDVSHYLNGIQQVSVGGESGKNARMCRYQWIEFLRRQCIEAGVSFYFHQTGAVFEKDGRVYAIERKKQYTQAPRAGLDI